MCTWWKFSPQQLAAVVAADNLIDFCNQKFYEFMYVCAVGDDGWEGFLSIH